MPVVFVQRVGQGLQIGLQGRGCVVRHSLVGWPLGLRPAGQHDCRCGEPGVNVDQGTPIGFVLAVFGAVLAGLRQRHQGGAGRTQRRGNGQLFTQSVDFVQVMAQRHSRLPQQGLFQGVGIDIGVAIAITANPAAHLQEGGQGGQAVVEHGLA